MALRTFTSAGVNNLWSNAANWNTGVPVDTDTFTLSAGQTCEFDADHTGWAGLGASTIPAGTTLIASTTAGVYCLKFNSSSDFAVNGTFQVGTSTAVPYPSTCTFTLNLSSTAASIGGSGKVYLYCNRPTYRKIALSAQEVINQTVLSVDTDVTGDIWADGDDIIVADVTTPGGDSELVQIAVGGIAATTITITGGAGAGGGLAAQKENGAYVILLTRNIRIINSTDYAARLNNQTSSYFDCEIQNTKGFAYGTSCTFAGCMWGGSGSNYGWIYGSNNILSGIMCQTNFGFTYAAGFSISGILVGENVCCQNCSSYEITASGELAGSGTGDYFGSAPKIFGTIKGCVTGLSYGSGVVGQCTFLNNTNDISHIGSGSFYSTAFSTGTEFANYNSADRTSSSYVESSNHDETVNAYKAWCRGGIVTSQTASPPTGYTIFYDHEVESATYPCFRQYQATVLPGTAIEVSAVIRNTDGIDVSTTTPIDLRPRLEIIDVFADPLVDSTQTALDSDAIAISDGSDSADPQWQAVDVIWANTGDAPRQVYVRLICYSHDASTHTIDEAWSVADYQDQIADTNKRVRRLSAGGEV